VEYPGTYIRAFCIAEAPNTSISYPGGLYTIAYDINDAGTIVGIYFGSDDNEHGFIYTGGSYSTFPDPLATGSLPTGINDVGEIVGENGNGQSFTYSGGNYQVIQDPQGVNGTYSLHVNDLGQIIGSYYDASHTLNGFLATRLASRLRHAHGKTKMSQQEKFGSFRTQGILRNIRPLSCQLDVPEIARDCLSVRLETC
jgi:uncharacterized membrane protein